MAAADWHDEEIGADSVDRPRHSIRDFATFDQVAAHIERQLDPSAFLGYTWQCERISFLYAKYKKHVPDRDFLRRAMYHTQKDWQDHLRWILTIAIRDGFSDGRIQPLIRLQAFHDSIFSGKRGTKLHVGRMFTDFVPTSKFDSLILVQDFKIEQAQVIYAKYSHVFFSRYSHRVPYAHGKDIKHDFVALKESIARKRAGLSLGIERMQEENSENDASVLMVNG